MTGAKTLNAEAFANRLRAIAKAVEKDPKRFDRTIQGFRLASGMEPQIASKEEDDDDNDKEAGWGTAAIILWILFF